MKKILAVIALPLLVLALVVGVTQSAEEAKPTKCDPSQLLPCLKSITYGIPPPPMCCSKLKQQKSCMCGYIKNPKFAKYVKSPNAKKTMKACHAPIPKCKH
ncbi:putative bifunctional inhibitor/plant lipid transfer protein/seed storage helical [Helianthus annuus]|nr:putative bifunctional inhibitor/plant lipid transfer protein/seed storage helical [Helianthus annuus]